MDFFQLSLKVMLKELKQNNLCQDYFVKLIPDIKIHEINFVSPYYRCAFMYRHATSIMYFTKKRIFDFLSHNAHVDFNTKLKNKQLCSLSNGPCLDYLSFTQAFSEFSGSCIEFSSVKVFTPCGSWRNTFNIIVETIQESFYLNSLSKFNFSNVTVVQKDVLKSVPKDVLKESEIVLMVKTLNLASPPINEEDILNSLKELISSIKPGGMAFCIDNKLSANLILKVLALYPGTFLHNPEFFTEQSFFAPEDFLKNLYGILPIINARGTFFVWQKLPDDPHWKSIPKVIMNSNCSNSMPSCSSLHTSRSESSLNEDTNKDTPQKPKQKLHLDDNVSVLLNSSVVNVSSSSLESVPDSNDLYLKFPSLNPPYPVTKKALQDDKTFIKTIPTSTIPKSCNMTVANESKLVNPIAAKNSPVIKSDQNAFKAETFSTYLMPAELNKTNTIPKSHISPSKSSIKRSILTCNKSTQLETQMRSADTTMPSSNCIQDLMGKINQLVTSLEENILNTELDNQEMKSTVHPFDNSASSSTQRDENNTVFNHNLGGACSRSNDSFKGYMSSDHHKINCNKESFKNNKEECGFQHDCMDKHLAAHHCDCKQDSYKQEQFNNSFCDHNCYCDSKLQSQQFNPQNVCCCKKSMSDKCSSCAHCDQYLKMPSCSYRNAKNCCNRCSLPPIFMQDHHASCHESCGQSLRNNHITSGPSIVIPLEGIDLNALLEVVSALKNKSEQ